jgi:YebC/PmpR family DNA-binding regulatory protein
MSGHNKWSTIKHKKGKADAARGKMFTKITREIITAAKIGGGDPDGNARLRAALLAARAVNMPNDNITRAIKKGTGELDGGAIYEEILYEGYGPAGVAVLVKVFTENRNRTVADVRHLFGKFGGNLGEAGCVSWMFSRKGTIQVAKDVTGEDHLIEVALEAGAEDVENDPDSDEFTVQCDPDSVDAVRSAIEAAGIAVASSEVAMVPQTTVPLSGKDAEKMLKFMNGMEEHDDVQNVFANFDISDEDLEAFGG